MSDDLIKRSDAIEVITYSNLNALTEKERVLLIQAIPSADRPRGEWIGNNLDGTFKVWDCSECGIHMETRWNYCPNCGARMKGADDGTDRD